MTTDYIVIKIASDALDASTLLFSQVALALGAFSTGASVLLLTDYFKRHRWQYKKKQKKKETTEKDSDNPEWVG
jgi:hypothetical protein